MITLPHCFPALRYLTLIVSSEFIDSNLSRLVNCPWCSYKAKIFGLSSLENHLGSGWKSGEILRAPVSVGEMLHKGGFDTLFLNNL